MNIVEALGGTYWFNVYAGAHLACLIIIAVVLLAMFLHQIM